MKFVETIIHGYLNGLGRIRLRFSLYNLCADWGVFVYKFILGNKLPSLTQC